MDLTKPNTPQIQIRLIKTSDTNELLEIIKNTSAPHTENYPKTKNELRRFIKLQIREKRRKELEMFVITKQNKICGTLELTKLKNNNGIYEIGYFIGKEYQGKGIATNAVELGMDYAKSRLKANGLTAYCDPKNLASIRILLKNKFKKIGLLKKFKEIEGRHHDRTIYWKKLS